jgi:hypothetical protein
MSSPRTYVRQRFFMILSSLGVKRFMVGNPLVNHPGGDTHLVAAVAVVDAASQSGAGANTRPL